MPDPRRSSRVTVLATVIGVVAVLSLAREVLVPVALAALVSFCLAPVTLRLQPWLGRVPAVIAAVLLACAILGGVTWLVAGQFVELARMVPQYRDNITAKIASLSVGVVEEATEAVKEIEKDVQAQRAVQKQAEQRERAAERAGERSDPQGAATSPPDPGATSGVVPPRVLPGVGGEPTLAPRDPALATPQEAPPVRVQVVEPEPTPLELIAGAFGPLLAPLAVAGIVIVLVIFMLLARQDLRDRIVRLVGRGKIGLTTQALDEAGRRVSRYLLMQTTINGITGVAVALGMLLLGVPGFFVWGLLSAVLRFVPYVGPWIAAAMPVLVALAVFDDWTSPLMVVGCFVLIELISNNVLEPWLYGTSAGVSPLAVIVTAIFWTWLWGPVGLLLATPITVCLVVMGKYVPQMQFANILFGDQPVLQPHARFYQRMVARNRTEAGEVAEQYLAARGSLAETFDVVMLPALVLVETDRATEAFDEERALRAQDVMRGVLAQLADAAADGSDGDADAAASTTAAEQSANQPERSALPPPKPLPDLPAELRVLLLPANDDADELAAAMLQHLVRACGAACETIPVAALMDGLVDVVQQHPADVVVVSAVPPSATVHARHVHKRLRARFPDLPLLVALWTHTTQLDDARQRLDAGERTAVVATLHDALVALGEIDRRARSLAANPAPAGVSQPG